MAPVRRIVCPAWHEAPVGIRLPRRLAKGCGRAWPTGTPSCRWPRSGCNADRHAIVMNIRATALTTSTPSWLSIIAAAEVNAGSTGLRPALPGRARTGISGGLGRRCRIVGRTPAWLSRLHRLASRAERRTAIHAAWSSSTDLGLRQGHDLERQSRDRWSLVGGARHATVGGHQAQDCSSAASRQAGSPSSPHCKWISLGRCRCGRSVRNESNPGNLGSPGR